MCAILHLPHPRPRPQTPPLPPAAISPCSLFVLLTLRPEAPASLPAPSPPPCVSAQLPTVVMTASQPDFSEKRATPRELELHTSNIAITSSPLDLVGCFSCCCRLAISCTCFWITSRSDAISVVDSLLWPVRTAFSFQLGWTRRDLPLVGASWFGSAENPLWIVSMHSS